MNRPTILGITSDVQECECCGKSNLKRTVVLDFGGAVKHYGTTCAQSAFFPHLSSAQVKNLAEKRQMGHKPRAAKQMVVKNGVVFWV